MSDAVSPTLSHLGALLVVAAALVEGLAQVSLKLGARAVTRARAWTALGVALFVIEIGLYTAGLKWLDVSVAYPISALNYGAVVVASALLLQERISARRWCGVALIVLGAALSAPH